MIYLFNLHFKHNLVLQWLCNWFYCYQIQFNSICLFFSSSQVWRENSFLTALCWPPRLFLQIAIISLFSCFRPSLSFATPLVALVSPICALNRESYNVQKFGLCHFAPLHISVYPLIFALLVEREYRRRFFVFPPECENERKYPVWSAAP